MNMFRSLGSKSWRLVGIGVGVLAGAAVVVAFVSTTAFAKGTARTFRGDGTYRVGTDIQAGTYRSVGGRFCYWARLSRLGGALDSIKADEMANYGPTVVTILPSDRGFETRACAPWSSNLKRITKSKTRFGQGTFIVGTDIAPGTYRNRSASGCSWARLRAFTGDRGAILASADDSGPTKVTIARSDRGFKSHGCGTWSR